MEPFERVLDRSKCKYWNIKGDNEFQKDQGQRDLWKNQSWKEMGNYIWKFRRG